MLREGVTGKYVALNGKSPSKTEDHLAFLKSEEFYMHSKHLLPKLHITYVEKAQQA